MISGCLWKLYGIFIVLTIRFGRSFAVRFLDSLPQIRLSWDGTGAVPYKDRAAGRLLPRFAFAARNQWTKPLQTFNFPVPKSAPSLRHTKYVYYWQYAQTM